MINDAILMGLAGVLATASPVIFAVIGETISERAGVINLSLNGAILLSANVTCASRNAVRGELRAGAETR